MRRLYLFLCLGLLLAGIRSAQATPFFARTYHFSCQTCHSGFPRLNPFGLAFKANNFRIPGGEKSARLAWEKTLPIATQIVPTYQRSSPRPRVSQFTDTQLLAGGLLTRTTAFYLHHSAWVDDKPIEFPSYEVWMQQVLDERSKLMFKIGQFELPYAYSPFIHQTTAFGPLLFGTGLQGNDVLLGSPMRGMQLSGTIARQARWYFAIGAPAVLTSGNANGKTEFFGELRDLFFRVSNHDLARNIGFFTYLTHPPRNPADPLSGDNGERYGLDGTLYWKGYQFSMIATYGENDNPVGKGTRGFFRGGLLEVDHMFFSWLGMTLRWEAQTTDAGGKRRYSDAKTVSVRFYPTEHLRLSLEYQQGDHDTSSTALLASLSF